MASSKTPAIIIENPNLGGIADSLYMGIKNSLAAIVCFDLHSIPGVMLVNQKFTKESGAPTDDYYKIVPCSNGNIYFFGKVTGNVWQNNGGVYTKLGTVAAGVLDAVEYNGFIYYAMAAKLGQWNFNAAFAGRNDTFGSFTNGNSVYHPIFFLANTQYIFIGDGNVIAQVDNSNVFTASALTTIAKNLTVTCLGSQGSNLLIGASILNGVSSSYILVWNTVITSVSNAYPLHESFINAFLPAEDEIICSAGISGFLYRMDAYGITFAKFKRIPPIFPNTYSPSNTMTVNYPAVANKQGIPIFGVSNISGNIALQGIYSFGSLNTGYQKILVLEYLPSTGNIANLSIWSLAVVGNDIYMSSYDFGAGTYQIDKLDWNNKFNGAYFDTLVIKYSRVWLDNFDKFITNLAQSLPANCQINVSYKINGGAWIAWVQGTELLSDTDRNSIVVDKRTDARTLQLHVSVTTYLNTAPIIEDMMILLKG